MDRLRDVRLRLERAQANFNRFDAEHAQYLAGPPVAYRAGAQVNAGGYGRIIVTELAPLPAHWTLLIADIITDSRDVLDYLAYQLVIRNTGRDPPPDAGRIEFPIFLDENVFFECGKKGQPSNRSGLAKSMNVSSGAQQFIWELQPCKMPGSDGLPEHNGLWLLHEICNTYKHRLLKPAVLRIQSTEVTITVESGTVSVQDVVGHEVEGALENGTELGTFRLVGAQAGTKLSVETRPSAYVGLEDGSPLARIGVYDFLNGTVGSATWITEELTRIGDLTAP